MRRQKQQLETAAYVCQAESIQTINAATADHTLNYQTLFYTPQSLHFCIYKKQTDRHTDTL